MFGRSFTSLRAPSISETDECQRRRSPARMRASLRGFEASLAKSKERLSLATVSPPAGHAGHEGGDLPRSEPRARYRPAQRNRISSRSNHSGVVRPPSRLAPCGTGVLSSGGGGVGAPRGSATLGPSPSASCRRGARLRTSRASRAWRAHAATTRLGSVGWRARGLGCYPPRRCPGRCASLFSARAGSRPPRSLTPKSSRHATLA